MEKFEVGKKYSMCSVCDTNCIWTFVVTRRTKSFVWIATDEGDVLRRKINIWNNTESCMPLGTFSMAPCLTAEKEF